jgi:hypothetical protein
VSNPQHGDEIALSEKTNALLAMTDVYKESCLLVRENHKCRHALPIGFCIWSNTNDLIFSPNFDFRIAGT